MPPGEQPPDASSKPPPEGGESAGSTESTGDAQPRIDTAQGETKTPDDGRLVDEEHAGHCFVVMPFGQDPAERKHFRGWYEVVIEPAIRDAGFVPILAAAVDEPNAINDEIRAHLAFDPVVVVDLGGVVPVDPPNPNVMYELGIRHALDLPLVLMAWDGQSLPFDISNQRALLGGREMLDIAPTRQRLVKFIQAACEGRFYRPMQAVRRIATVDLAATDLTEQTVLGAVAEELRELRHAVSTRSDSRRRASSRTDLTSRTRSKALPLAKLVGTRKESLNQQFLEMGGTQVGWAALMGARLKNMDTDPRAWSDSQWQVLFDRYIEVGQPRGKEQLLSVIQESIDNPADASANDAGEELGPRTTSGAEPSDCLSEGEEPSDLHGSVTVEPDVSSESSESQSN